MVDWVSAGVMRVDCEATGVAVVDWASAGVMRIDCEATGVVVVDWTGVMRVDCETTGVARVTEARRRDGVAATLGRRDVGVFWMNDPAGRSSARIITDH